MGASQPASVSGTIGTYDGAPFGSAATFVPLLPLTVEEARGVLGRASVGLTPGLVSANVPTPSTSELEAAIRVIARDEIAKSNGDVEKQAGE